MPNYDRVCTTCGFTGSYLDFLPAPGVTTTTERQVRTRRGDWSVTVERANHIDQVHVRIERDEEGATTVTDLHLTCAEADRLAEALRGDAPILDPEDQRCAQTDDCGDTVEWRDD